MDIRGDDFSEAIQLLVGGEKDIKRWFPYSQKDTRRVPEWAELWRSRSSLVELLTASDGYQHRQKDVETQVGAAVKALKVDVEKNASLVEGVGYRIRAMMGHARNTKLGMWLVPKKYQSLSGVIDLARVEAPPRRKRDRSGNPEIESMEELQALGDISDGESSSVEVTHDSSRLTEAELDNVLQDIFKNKKRLHAKTSSSSDDVYMTNSKPYSQAEKIAESDTDDEPCECPTTAEYTKLSKSSEKKKG